MSLRDATEELVKALRETYEPTGATEFGRALLQVEEQLAGLPSVTDGKQASAWHIVELYGHRRLVGQVSQASFPEGFVRIDTIQGPTQLYNPKAVFSLLPVTEEAARSAAPSCDEPAPIKPWENGQQKRIDALRAALGRVARGEVAPAIDFARGALVADDRAAAEEADEEWPL